jgi:CRP-like cAMP-binding protein
VDQKRPPIYFQTISDCTIHLVPKDIFQQHLKEDNSLSNSFTRRVIEQFAYYASSLNNLALKYGQERLYYRLLLLSARFGEEKDGLILIPSISQADLGATINMTRESTNKEIAKLEKLGVMEYTRANIILKDTEFLKRELGKNTPVLFFDNI